MENRYGASKGAVEDLAIQCSIAAIEPLIRASNLCLSENGFNPITVFRARGTVCIQILGRLRVEGITIALLTIFFMTMNVSVIDSI